MELSVSTEEELLEKHKKERKTLQAEVQKIKHAVPKGDKKRKKDAQVQIAQMEAELDAKQKAEMDAFAAGGGAPAGEQAVENVTDQLNDLATGDAEEEPASGPQKGKKMSKAQKRREKKDQEAKQREERIKEQEIINIDGPRHQETKLLKEKLKAKDLAIYEVPSDGNCLYAALVHQLDRREVKSSVESLRKQCADHMGGHADDFLPFLCHTDSGDPFTEEQYQKYLEELESTAAWGGQLEIRALANVLRLPIEVLQAESPVVLQGEEFKEDPLVLIYHRHMYGLGEHYNSVIPISEVKEEEDEFS